MIYELKKADMTTKGGGKSNTHKGQFKLLKVTQMISSIIITIRKLSVR